MSIFCCHQSLAEALQWMCQSYFGLGKLSFMCYVRSYSSFIFRLNCIVIVTSWLNTCEQIFCPLMGLHMMRGLCIKSRWMHHISIVSCMWAGYAIPPCDNDDKSVCIISWPYFFQLKLSHSLELLILTINRK